MQEIFPTRLMDATGRLYSERASLVRRSKRSSFRYSTARKSVAIAGDAARRDEVRLISLSLTCLLRRIPPGFRRETRRFILRGENSRQVPHELSRFPLHVNRRAQGDWRQGAGGMPLTALCPANRADQARINASRSALIVSAWEVCIPCGKRDKFSAGCSAAACPAGWPHFYRAPLVVISLHHQHRQSDRLKVFRLVGL